MDFEGPFNPTSGGSHYIFVIVNHSTSYNITVPIRKTNAHHAVNAKIQSWISILCPPQVLITERRIEKLKSETANCCTPITISRSSRTSHAPLKKELVETLNKKIVAII